MICCGSEWDRGKSAEDTVDDRRGGRLAPDNEMLACDPCNVDKGHRSLEAWLDQLGRRGDRRAEIVASLVHRAETPDQQRTT
jgi:hypothetical protein